MHLLLVDDSALVRRMVKTRLGPAHGILVVEAASVREARQIAARDCDVALLDLELDDGTGVDVARAVLRVAPACRVAFFTTAHASALADEARAFGPVFEKPHDLADAVAWLHGSLSRTPSAPGRRPISSRRLRGFEGEKRVGLC